MLNCIKIQEWEVGHISKIGPHDIAHDTFTLMVRLKLVRVLLEYNYILFSPRLVTIYKIQKIVTKRKKS